ncbi:isochorismatase family cysteine hydrolase [Nocardiopsis sp. NPDC101807]|uniref:isochorismatase family cysteine hydrolase n=1 Tax=Nocardiopsis sp. NPDC101807 TaxID=3364339 RepID=UPI0037FDB8CE
MDITRQALIVVDVQNGFLNDHSRPMLTTLSRLVAAWTLSGRPVVFTRYINHPGSPFDRLLNWTRLQEPPETDIATEIAHHTADAAAVIDKHGYSCFTDDFHALLGKQEWRDLYFCGVATESCVLKSAVDAFELGLVPRIVTDASASDAGAHVHEAGLTVARRFIGAHHLVTTEQVLSELTPTTASGTRVAT